MTSNEILEIWDKYYKGEISRNEADKLIRGDKVEDKKVIEHVPGRYQPNGKYGFTTSIVEYCRIFNICCKTEQEAEFILRQKKAKLALIDKIHELNDGWVPDWSNYEDDKWYFYYNHTKNRLVCTIIGNFQESKNELYFKSEEIGDQIISELGEPLIKLALWGIE